MCTNHQTSTDFDGKKRNYFLLQSSIEDRKSTIWWMQEKKKIMVTFRKAQSKSMTFQIGFLFLLVFLSLLWVATLLLGLWFWSWFAALLCWSCSSKRKIGFVTQNRTPTWSEGPFQGPCSILTLGFLAAMAQLSRTLGLLSPPLFLCLCSGLTDL